MTLPLDSEEHRRAAFQLMERRRVGRPCVQPLTGTHFLEYRATLALYGRVTGELGAKVDPPPPAGPPSATQGGIAMRPSSEPGSGPGTGAARRRSGRGLFSGLIPSA